MQKILVISQASFTAINRTVYQRLASKGWQIEMIVPQQLHFPAGIKNAEAKSLSDPPIHFLPLVRNNPRLQWYKGLEDVLKKTKPAIVFLDNDPASYMAMRLSVWCKKQNTKLVCQSCENLSQAISVVFKREGIRGLLPAIIKNYFIWRGKSGCSHVFTINEDGLQLFKKAGYLSVSKTPLGFDENLFKQENIVRNSLRDKLGLNQITFAYFGRLVPEKGVHLLIEALSGLQEYKWYLMMDKFEVYASEYNITIEKLIEEKGIKKRIKYIHANHQEVPNFMNAADVVILPSISTSKWKEQYGRVVPEAMACGKIVIGANSGALPELIEDAGIIFPEGDVKCLKNLLEEILKKNTAYEFLKYKAIERAHSFLSIKAQVDIMHECFLRLLNSNKAA